MAFFGNNTVEEKSSEKPTIISATMITQCITMTGNIKGCGTVHIDGTIEGDVEVDEGIVLGESGKILGNITSKEITISGELTGRIFGEKVEITQNGKVSNDIHAVELIVDGHVEGFVQADERIHVAKHGHIRTEKMESKLIVVNGEIEGSLIATEMLEINTNGKVTGDMTIKKIKVAEGGMMLGSMQTYQSALAEPASTAPAESSSSTDEASEPSTEAKADGA